jgi:PAS domain-containing protein
MERFAAGGDTPVSAVLDALATRMGLGLLLIDSGSHPVYSNRAARELLGCTEAGSLRDRWAVLQSLKSAGPPPDATAAHSFTADLPVDGATRYLRGEVRPAGGGFEVFLKDRRSLGELDIELLCASRMREWIHQSDALVHDANGALNTIQLTLELLDGQWPGPKAGEQSREPNRRNHVGVIRDNLDKLKGTLRQLGSAHDSATGPAAFDLRDVVREAATTLRMPARRHRIDLQVRLGETALPAQGNRARLRLALVNVALCRVESLAERSHLVLEANAVDEGLEIICRDEGALAETARDGIFKVFLAEPGAGSGADALRLARALVECEAGEFQVAGNAVPGTTFRFLFPRLA